MLKIKYKAMKLNRSMRNCVSGRGKSVCSNIVTQMKKINKKKGITAERIGTWDIYNSAKDSCSLKDHACVRL